MRHNAHDNLKMAYEKLCLCDRHLNIAFDNAENPNNKSEIRNALRVVGDAINSTQHTMLHYKD